METFIGELNLEAMTKEEQIWRNSNYIAGQVFNLRNWFHVMERLLDPEASYIRKDKAVEEINKALDYLAQLNRENMNLTSKNSEL